jgi:hypothetical protein
LSLASAAPRCGWFYETARRRSSRRLAPGRIGGVLACGIAPAGARLLLAASQIVAKGSGKPLLARFALALDGRGQVGRAVCHAADWKGSGAALSTVSRQERNARLITPRPAD